MRYKIPIIHLPIPNPSIYNIFFSGLPSKDLLIELVGNSKIDAKIILRRGPFRWPVIIAIVKTETHIKVFKNLHTGI